LRARRDVGRDQGKSDRASKQGPLGHEPTFPRFVERRICVDPA
jgi:hypothetical protein